MSEKKKTRLGFDCHLPSLFVNIHSLAIRSCLFFLFFFLDAVKLATLALRTKSLE
jgi:hypothetical protein